MRFAHLKKNVAEGHATSGFPADQIKQYKESLQTRQANLAT
jgi:hypothetical protein